MAILDILTQEQIRSKVQDTVLFESPIYKYKPGISIQYIVRWGQVTRNEFMYFKNQWGANCWLSKPIIILPLNCIKSVQRVQVETRKISQKLKKNEKKNVKALVELDNYQFEIFLKEEVDFAAIARKNEISLLENKSLVLGGEEKNKNIQLEEKLENPDEKEEQKSNEKEELVKIDEVNENLIVQNSLNPNQKHNVTVPEIKVDKNESLLMEEHKASNIDIDSKSESDAKNIRLSTPLRKIVEISPGHLMKTPNSKNSNKDIPINPPENQQENIAVIEDKVKFCNQKEYEQFKNFKEENSQLFQTIGSKEEISVKNHSAWIPSLSSKHKN